MKIKTCSVAAVGRNNVIGADGKIPWNLPSDLRHFKELTKDHVVIMGRNTWESLPKKPLPNRYNIVLSSHPTAVTSEADNDDATVVAVNTVQRAWHVGLFETRRRRLDNLFVIGGESVYKAFWPFINTHIITMVPKEVPNGDTFYPSIDPELFTCEPVSMISSEKDECDSMIFKFERRED